MKRWSGSGVFQWEHIRKWDLAAGANEICRAEGALLVPGGLRSFSIFFRRNNQSGGTMELALWTSPIFYEPLDDDFTAAPVGKLFQLAMEPTGNLSMTGTAAQVFAARLQDDQPMGTMLFWQMKNTGATLENITGDIYIVPNHSAVLSFPTIGRTADVGEGPGRSIVAHGVSPMASKLVRG